MLGENFLTFGMKNTLFACLYFPNKFFEFITPPPSQKNLWCIIRIYLRFSPFSKLWSMRKKCTVKNVLATVGNFLFWNQLVETHKQKLNKFPYSIKIQREIWYTCKGIWRSCFGFEKPCRKIVWDMERNRLGEFTDTILAPENIDMKSGWVLNSARSFGSSLRSQKCW